MRPGDDDDLDLAGEALAAHILQSLQDVLTDDDDLGYLLKEKETPYE